MWAPREFPHDRAFDAGPADGWVSGERLEDRRAKTLVAFLPRDYVAAQIRAKERELAMLQSCVGYNDLRTDPNLADSYVRTRGDFAHQMRMLQDARGAEPSAFGGQSTPDPGPMDLTGQPPT